MKLLLRTLLLLTMFLWIIGGVIYINNPVKGQVYIGFGVLILALILMPLFIYHRYSKKDLSQYSFNQDEDNS